MIDARELRIGNWVNWPTAGEVFISSIEVRYDFENDFNIGAVLGYDKQKIVCASVEPFCFEPIPLTPEILLKCGFEDTESLIGFSIKTKETKYHKPNFSGRWIKYKLTGKPIEKEFLRIDSMTDCYYLHQLQNLYFALTGTELEINL